jgi:hypothetical protein
MKFERASMFRAATAVAATVTFATVMTVTAIPVPARADGGPIVLEICNNVNGLNNAIDAWLGTTEQGQAQPGECTPIDEATESDVTVNFYINNTGTWVGYVSYYADGRVEAQFTEDQDQVALQITSNDTSDDVDYGDAASDNQTASPS